ncbi:P-loop containing nucleoside triphosphate hydrolase [Glarea lozoyensis ATCC 20868]|uniref:p-loop containing nucleoside triphosphate hydrolase n=1 Tax=Glarea lozoyensis (strain ATCC 20868 / MF5171) TaxID=1116229 RepID=S3D1H5_GLAL2|nr:P-loop containing nucleoside triphosphate hydrolase [Glarea lozoyensis ATCC 20868]EPE25871.1 P-loop containing nucleoside triphosphate hydrolase [Glarea lozoyensis ATCC 20868]
MSKISPKALATTPRITSNNSFEATLVDSRDPAISNISSHIENMVGAQSRLTIEQLESNRLKLEHLELLRVKHGERNHHEATNAPLLTMPVMEHVQRQDSKQKDRQFPQYGLIAGAMASDNLEMDKETRSTLNEDPRIFFNIATPSSTFICGSQGSGKSHTLSCMLENVLAPSVASQLPHPLTALVFHYDTFISDRGGSPCEAAFLASNKNIKVRVLCAPTNLATIQLAYSKLNVDIVPLKINQTDLNTKRMLDLMAVKQDDGPMPLYLHTIYRILRDMRMKQQKSGALFDYGVFKQMVGNTTMTPAQLGPLTQRLETLESFMNVEQTNLASMSGKKKAKGIKGIDWSPRAGTLTIVDLSCPCVTPEGACALFNICLSIFLEGDTKIGRVVALDEAHKYMNKSAEASTLTDTLLATIRLQRHLGTRIIISTQEPTVSPALLDLSSVTIVHRFTSPEWLLSLKGHLAGVASKLIESEESQNGNAKSELSTERKVFTETVKLKVGEALLFSPSAVIGIGDEDGNDLKKLGAGYLKIRVRSRLTTDGGKSVMAE